MHIRYLKPTSSLGKCYDRSLFMFFCFDDALLVRADQKDLELQYGKDYAGHGWIEIGDFVYDPSLMLRFDRDLYYKIYKSSNVLKFTKDDYKKINGSYYDEIRNTKLEDFQIGGRKRLELCINIPLITGIAEYSDDANFKRELHDYLTLIQYNEKEVHHELVSSCFTAFKKKNI